MMTQKLYFGQFSGDDHLTYEDWDQDFDTALGTNNVRSVFAMFKRYAYDFRFADMLNPTQADMVANQMKSFVALIENQSVSAR